MAARVSKWNPEIAIRIARKGMKTRMKVATVVVRDTIKVSINRGNLDGSNPSRPGEPPKKVSSMLFRNITEEVLDQGDEIVGRSGTNIEYARRLELGFVGTDSLGRTYDQAPRPFIRPGLAKSLRKVKQILGAK